MNLADEHDVEVLVCSEDRCKSLSNYLNQLLAWTACAAEAKRDPDFAGVSNLNEIRPIKLAVEDKRRGETLLQ